MKDHPEIVARTGLIRRPDCTYSIVGCDVWERENKPDAEDVRVASAQFTREPGSMYALDSDGNIVRLLTPTFSIDDSDELAKARTKRFFADVEKLTRSRDDK